MLLCWSLIVLITLTILQLLTPPQPLKQDCASPLTLCWSFILFIKIKDHPSGVHTSSASGSGLCITTYILYLSAMEA